MRVRVLMALLLCVAWRIDAPNPNAPKPPPTSAMPVDIIADAALAYGVTIPDLDRNNRVSVYDRRFIDTAAQAGHAKLVYAKLALRHAVRDETRAYAQRIINDQMATNSELRILAEARNIIMPTDLDGPHKVEHQALARLQGEAFDDAYCEQETRANMNAVNLFKGAAASATDEQLRTWATHRLPLFEQHAQLVRELSQGRKPVS